MSAVGEARPEAAAGTADELLSIAERLFAERGVENVALTQIVAQSSQRNRSAVHYHFGSREGVLTAVLNRRLAPLNARREALIEALPQRPSVAAIVRATIAPLGLAVVEAPWGPDYLSLVAQVRFRPTLFGAVTVEDEHLSGLRRCHRLLAAAAPQLPDALLHQRLAWLTDSVVFALARWVRDTPPPARTVGAMAGLIDQLTAYGAAGLVAPDPSSPPSAPEPLS
jgi:AcrR family transcriptional regulator